MQATSKDLRFHTKEIIDAGAEILVSGSGIFGTPDPAETIRKFKNL